MGIFGVPPLPYSQCTTCLALPPLEAILASLARQTERQREAEAGSGGKKPGSGGRKRTEAGAGADEVRRLAYPLDEAARLLGCSLTKVKDEVRKGKLATVRVGERRRVLESEIKRYLTRGQDN